MSAHDEQTIDRAVRAMGRALAAGSDHKTAMRAALNAAASTGCLREYVVTVAGVKLTCGFGADIEDGWIITGAPGEDLAPMLTQSDLFAAIDRAVIRQMERETNREALDRIEERHELRRAA